MRSERIEWESRVVTMEVGRTEKKTEDKKRVVEWWWTAEMMRMNVSQTETVRQFS